MFREKNTDSHMETECKDSYIRTKYIGQNCNETFGNRLRCRNTTTEGKKKRKLLGNFIGAVEAEGQSCDMFV